MSVSATNNIKSNSETKLSDVKSSTSKKTSVSLFVGMELKDIKKDDPLYAEFLKADTDKNEELSENELKKYNFNNEIEKLCEKYKVDYKIIKNNQKFNFIIQTNFDNLDKLLKCFEAALQDIKADKEFNEKKLIGKCSAYFDCLTSGGWNSIDAIRKGRQEDIAARINRVTKSGKNFHNMSEEEKEKELKLYFDNYFNDMKKNGKSNGYIKKIQIQDFTKLILNTTDDNERKWLLDASKHLLADNKYPALQAVIDSYENQEKLEKDLNTERIMKLAYSSLEQDINDNYMSEKDITNLNKLLFMYSSVNEAKKVHNVINTEIAEFVEKNQANIDKIFVKISHHEELSTEEQEIFQQLKRYSSLESGQVIGISSNNIMTNEEKSTCLTNFMEDFHNNQTDAMVIENVKQYISENNDNTDNTELNDTLNTLNQLINDHQERYGSPYNNSQNETDNTPQESDCVVSQTVTIANHEQNNSIPTLTYTSPQNSRTTNPILRDVSQPEKVDSDIQEQILKNYPLTGISKKDFDESIEKLDKLISSGELEKNPELGNVIKSYLEKQPPMILLILFENSSDKTKLYLLSQNIVKKIYITNNFNKEIINNFSPEIKEILGIPEYD